MKALKINAAVNLNSGLSTKSGAIVIISEGYANIAGIITIPAIEEAKATENSSAVAAVAEQKFIPCQVSCCVFASLDDLNAGKAKLEGIADFNTSFPGLRLTVESYEKLNTQELLIGVVEQVLNTVYPNKIEIIEL